jgi:hypothetical protein
MARIVDRPCDLKTLAETHATLHPQPKAGLTLNLSQQQGQNQKTAVSAQDALECFAGQDRMAIVESESHD